MLPALCLIAGIACLLLALPGLLAAVASGRWGGR